MGVTERRTSVSGDIESVRLACDFVVEFVKEAELGEDVAFQAELSVEEVCTNIVEHGYNHDGSDKKIEIVCSYQDHDLRITIIDQAPPFNPLELKDPNPDTPLWDRKGGGWGVYFVKQYMTSVSYELVGGKNHLILTKKLA